MSPDTRWMSSVAAPTVKTTSIASIAPAAPPVEAARPATAPPVAESAPATRSLRAAAIRARTWQAAWVLALRRPCVETFEGLAANPSGSLQRALRWATAGLALGYALPALFSLVRGGAALPALLFVYGLLVVVSVAGLAGGAAVACAAAAHLAAYGLQPRPHVLERQAPAAPTAPAASGVFQKAVYVRLAYACAAFAAPLSVALGVALVMPDLLRGLLLIGLTVWAGVLSVLAVRAACRVSWMWAGVAGVAGSLCALLPLAAVAGAWVGLVS